MISGRSDYDFGPLHLSLHQTESLGDALLDFQSLDDLINWLNSHN